MTKNMSWTGTHPAVDLWAEARQERDEWQVRAEAAEKRIAELEAQLAAQAWRPMETVPDGEDVELLVHGYIGEDEYWYYRDETEPIQAWRPLPAPA